jgi:transposase InsO family protein
MSLSGRPEKWFLCRIGLRPSKLADWRRRRGLPNAPAGNLSKSHWLTEREKCAIVDYYQTRPGDGYRRCAHMMVDEDVAYASPATVYRVLRDAGVLSRSDCRASLKGTGFEQPNRPHEHWHTDISYVKVGSRFYYLVCVLDGYSRFIVHWGLRESMEERDVAVVQQMAVEKHPGMKTRYITDNGSQFTGREFRRFIAFHGLTHVRTSPNYPQSNGKVERFHSSIKGESLNRRALLTVEQAVDVIGKYVTQYNEKRLHSAIGYVAPKDRLEGKDGAIQAARAEKMRLARARREACGTTAKEVGTEACNLHAAE